MLSNNSNFKRFQLLGNDGKKWIWGKDNWHVITKSRCDTSIHDSKGFYEYLVQLFFLHKCDCSFNICLWSRVLKREGIVVKVATMGEYILCIEPSMIEDSAYKPLILYMLKEGGLVSFMEALNGFDESCSQQFVNF